MADSFWRRLLGSAPGNGNGNGRSMRASEIERRFRPTLQNAKGVTLRLGPNIQFFSPDGTRTIHRIFGGILNGDASHVNRDTAFAAAAYMYVAIRYRMKKVAEPPLMVVKEDEQGVRDWQQKHPVEQVLDEPSPDFDMGGLLARTQAYIDVSGRALWKKDLSRGGLVGRLTPFSGHEFSTAEADGRIYGSFKVDTATGPEYLAPEQVVFFDEINPFDWHQGTSMVDVCLGWLNLGQEARTATIDILRHSLFPSVIVQADKDWNPSPEEYEEWKQGLDSYAERDRRGGPLGLVGGGTATKVGLTLRDLIPGDILDRVESIVAAVSGIPAIILQYQIGMENSPWSQMAQARRMAYEDTIEPLWREYEKRLTRQLLQAPVERGGKPLETDRALRIVFDVSNVRALQVDRLLAAQTVANMRSEASLNERRQILGLEPVDDPKADEIPELAQPPAPQLPAGFTNPFEGEGDEGEDEGEEEEEGNRRGRRERRDEEEEEVERGRRSLPFLRKVGSSGRLGDVRRGHQSRSSGLGGAGG